MNQDCGMIKIEDFREMLRTFSKLKGYEGWLLAQMSWHVTAHSCKESRQNAGAREQETANEIIVSQERWQIQEKKKKAFATITLSKTGDGYRHEIVVFLIKPKAGSRSDQQPKSSRIPLAASRSDQQLSPPRISFSSSQIEQYLTQTKDYNPIHKGERAIVPGFLILQKILFEYHFLEKIKENAGYLQPQSQSPESTEMKADSCDKKQEKASFFGGDFVLDMTWKDVLYCDEECTLALTDAGTLQGKKDHKIIWSCQVKDRT